MVKKKKKETLSKRLSKRLSKKIVGKNILKKDKVTVTIKERPKTNIFQEENKFFKGEFSKEKKNMFLS